MLLLLLFSREDHDNEGHELCHISLFVKAFGPPMGISCFPYGNANDHMKVGAWYKIHCLTGL